MAPIASIMGQVLQVGLFSRSGATDTTRLREIADTVVWPRLRARDGVAQVVRIGGSPKELQIVVDARALKARDGSMPPPRQHPK